ncbi:Zinc finger SWIM domain-containing protein 7 [Branchiostoma belcheri]|nr:Zinc finger SWIM domain-containing protein 7 [Branchiostoma belcheri]
MACVPLGTVAAQLLLEVKHVHSSNGCLSDDLLSALQDVFGTSLLGRHLYLVVGSSGRLYTCLPSGLYCPCTYFTYAALMKGEALVCKHVLAVQLSQAMEACQELNVSDEELVGLLMNKDTAAAQTVYCPCTYFTYAALMKGEALVCKHVLAVQLSQAMEACQELNVSDEELVGLYCPCTHFTYATLMKGEALVCKHVLAVQLSQAMEACQELNVSDEELDGLLMNKDTAAAQ